MHTTLIAKSFIRMTTRTYEPLKCKSNVMHTVFNNKTFKITIDI